MSVINGQLANASTFNSAFVSKTADSTTSGTLTQDKESVLKEIATPATPSSGYGKIYFKADGKLYQLNDAGIETQVGTGTGGGGATNFITNGSAEDNNTTGWGTYADAAGSSPVDGDGGTANVTISTSASSPLIGTYSFLMVKDAVNRQGQGWEYDFTIDSAYKAKVLQIDFEYLVSSGTFTAGTSSADSDVTVWIYDVTNGVVIQPSSYKLLSNSSTISSKHTATFQTASNSTAYRLIFHVATTSASAYTLKVDGVSVSPSTYVYGSPVTDWQSYTPSSSGFNIGSTGTSTVKYRRIGSDIHVIGNYVAGGVGIASSGDFSISLPSGLTFDSTKISFTEQVIGSMECHDSTIARYGGITIIAGSSTVTFPIRSNAATGGNNLSNTQPSASWFNTAGDAFSFEFIAPITGWGASVQMSSETDTRVVAAAANTLSSTTLPANAALLFNTTTIDTHGAITTGAGYKYTVPVSGNYRISSTVPPITAGSNSLYVAKNGSFTFTAQNLITSVSTSHGGGGSIVLSLVSGDTIQFSFSSAATASNTNANFAIERLSGPSAIAATETVAAIYQTSAGQSIPFNVETVVVFGTKIYDSHSAMNAATGVYTCPISGEYEVSGGIYFASAITATATDVQFIAYKNGSAYLGVNNPKSGTAATPMTTSGTIKVRCNAGDTLSVAVRQNNSASTAQALISSAAFNWASITRVGN